METIQSKIDKLHVRKLVAISYTELIDINIELAELYTVLDSLLSLL